YRRRNSLISRIVVYVGRTAQRRKPGPSSVELDLSAAQNWRLVTEDLGVVSDQIGETVSIDILKRVRRVEVLGDLRRFGRGELEESMEVSAAARIGIKSIPRSVPDSDRREEEGRVRRRLIVDEVVEPVTIEVGESRGRLRHVDRR